jgi:peptidoglycan/xylan/chitin deacetylase (PgdA/CDA1 family)
MKATGGTVSTGGAKATGGTSSTGGTVSTGGSSSSTGGSPPVTFKCSNLSLAPAATGKAKPSGAVGGLKVLDWAGFTGAVSYTFDDANSSQISNYTAMKNAGGHYTFYLQTGKSDAGNGIWKTALQDGNELGNHTSDHSNCTSASAIDSAQTFIKSNFGVTAYAFAAPNGASACQTYSNKFLTNRSVSGNSSIGAGVISSFSWISADIPPAGAAASALAPITGKWRILCIHGFTGGSDGAYQAIPISSFTSAASSAVSGGSWVETITNVAAYQYGQNAIASKSGNSISWTLPAVFPPNMCVRVTTTGGTVTQNGAAVPWNSHGYYEISLDAKSVTVQ